MTTEIPDTNIESALLEIDRVNGAVPIDQRGGEVLDQVNEVFNLMAMNIKKTAKNKRSMNAAFGNEIRSKPNVIYIKGPRDRLLMMTESVDQSLQNFSHDPQGMYGGKSEYKEKTLGDNTIEEEPLPIIEEVKIPPKTGQNKR
jgi:hypothetical protein